MTPVPLCRASTFWGWVNMKKTCFLISDFRMTFYFLRHHPFSYSTLKWNIIFRDWQTTAHRPDPAYKGLTWHGGISGKVVFVAHPIHSTILYCRACCSTAYPHWKGVRGLGERVSAGSWPLQGVKICRWGVWVLGLKCGHCQQNNQWVPKQILLNFFVMRPIELILLLFWLQSKVSKHIF